MSKEDRPYIQWGDSGLYVALPHHCDEWVIGNVRATRRMIARLTALLPGLDHPERYRHQHRCGRCKAAVFRAGRTCPRWCSGRDRHYVCSACFYYPQQEEWSREDGRSFPDQMPHGR